MSNGITNGLSRWVIGILLFIIGTLIMSWATWITSAQFSRAEQMSEWAIWRGGVNKDLEQIKLDAREIRDYIRTKDDWVGKETPR